MSATAKWLPPAALIKKRLGEDARAFKDADGNPLKFDAIAQKPDGEITAMDIKLPKPVGPEKKDPKEIYATKINDLICGVGYYYYREGD
jgi:hypothetical protein